ncbi:Guanosine nucleotide diphosphate dissociation inhibitor 1 [Zea mays]|uniref:Guanosine nucleotide diphosphate dissociation inhibitor n=1 Tax=Zea mays TaxID=4577 RepID=A0A3L6DJB2_MAIZE|nr:Guanosine nucleotide diphosphate dissociation inhibitor 1 [Zea mays]
MSRLISSAEVDRFAGGAGSPPSSSSSAQSPVGSTPDSLARFQGGSPYIYPLYGLGELPQGFARLSAVYGGTYMLNKPDCKVEFDMEGKVCGVTSEGETAKCKKVVCDPSYLQNKVRKIGRVVCAIAIMSHPIPNTNESHSVQIILPQKQLGRRSDMYVFCCSYTHNVAPRGKFIAFVSVEAETDNPQSELKPGIDLLGSVDEIFYDIYDRYEPVNEPSLDNCFVSTSYDATTHFETTVTDVLNMYTMTTGKCFLAFVYGGDPLTDLSLHALLDKFMENKPRGSRIAEGRWHGGSQIAPAKKLNLNHHIIGELLELSENEVPPEDIVFHRFYLNKTGPVKHKAKWKDSVLDEGIV